MNAARTTNRWTPLTFAAKRNHLSTVQLLLLKGADKNARTASNKTAVSYATDPAVKAAFRE